MLRIALLSSAFLLSAPAFAIYKCESNGKISYSDTACPGGTALPIKNTPTDDTEARQQLVDDKKKLKQLELERQRREARQEREERRHAQQAARAHAAKEKKCTNLAMRSKWAQEDAAKATIKTIDQAKTKARRAEEKYAAECGA